MLFGSRQEPHLVDRIQNEELKEARNAQMPQVKFNRSVTVPTAADRVWSTVTDVGRVAGWVTVVGSVTELEPLSRYRAELADRLGPFRLTAELDVRVTDAQEPRTISFVADGEDRQVASRIKVEATVSLASEDEATVVTVDGAYEVTGRVAGLGAAMIRAKGEKILEEFFSTLETEFG